MVLIRPFLTTLLSIVSITILGQIENKKITSDFLPKGYVVFKETKGDLNKDGVDDCVLVIKGTDKDKMVTDFYGKKVDRNRRGIIILLKKGGLYEMALQNDSCFSSENEDGGVYFPPELSLSINKGNLYVHYGHGRYGYWTYTFRYQNSGFALIGYDESNGGAVVNSEISINFLTKKKLIRVNTNENAQSGEEVFKETWSRISIHKLIHLSQIQDFDELDMTVY